MKVRSLGYDGVQSESQLAQKLEVTVAKLRNYFEWQLLSAVIVES